MPMGPLPEMCPGCRGVVTPARWVGEFLQLRFLPFQLLLEWPDARRGQGRVCDPHQDPLLQVPEKLVVGVLNVQSHAVQDVQEEGLAVCWSACPQSP